MILPKMFRTMFDLVTPGEGMTRDSYIIQLIILSTQLFLVVGLVLPLCKLCGWLPKLSWLEATAPLWILGILIEIAWLFAIFYGIFNSIRNSKLDPKKYVLPE